MYWHIILKHNPVSLAHSYDVALKVAKMSMRLHTWKPTHVELLKLLNGNPVLCRVSQVNEDGEDPLFGITLIDGLEQKGKFERHKEVPSLQIILMKFSGKKLL